MTIWMLCSILPTGAAALPPVAVATREPLRQAGQELPDLCGDLGLHDRLVEYPDAFAEHVTRLARAPLPHQRRPVHA